MRYVGYLLLAVGTFVFAVANAKCAYSSTSERLAEYETVVLVSIESAREVAVPVPYGLSRDTVPGKLLTLRVVRSWKGSFRPGDVVSGWTWSPRVEDAYTHTDLGAKLLVFFPKDSPHEITSCNTAPPDRLNKTSEELDAIVRKRRSGGAPPEVRTSEKYGFVDIDLPIYSVSTSGGIVRIVARGDADGADVGFEIDFPSRAGSSRSALLPIGSAVIRSIGAPSDHFMLFLAQRYKLPGTAWRMASSLRASVVGLEGDPADVLDGRTEMKFFFYDSGPESRYAEVFINVDVAKRVVEFHEKDPDYRKPLLMDLAKGPA